MTHAQETCARNFHKFLRQILMQKLMQILLWPQRFESV